MTVSLSHKILKRCYNCCYIIFYPIYRRYLTLFNIYIAGSSHVSRCAILDTKHGGFISVGENTEILDGARLATYSGNIVIGDYSSINSLVTIYGHGGVRIGNHVLIATQVVIIPANHNAERCDIPIAQQGLNQKGIVIEDNVWIGAGAKILDGVTVATGSVIGANCVVTKDTQPNGIYVGIPARLLRYRGSPAK